MDLFSSLNEPQLKAVRHGEGPLLVLAGAGSGKTRVIVHRIAWLIREKKVPPAMILAVTFTNKAAGEMRQRIAELLGDGDLPQVGTFHATCARILRREIGVLGYGTNFVIYDEKDSERLLRDVCRDMKVDEKKYPLRSVAALIDDCKNDGLLPDEWTPSFSGGAELLRSVYATYQNRLRSANALDFGDLVMLTVRIFRDYPDILHRYQERWQWLLIDEYQDTNRVQYELVRLLAGVRRNLCVVGDDDQSIYRWRGADIRNILEFERDFPGVTVVKLEQNYRSTATILKGAIAVVTRNRGRKGKTLWTDNPVGEPIVCRQRDDDWDEARYVAREVESLLELGVDPGEIAVFYRTNAQSRVLEEVLLSSRISYRVVGGFRFYDRQEIRDLMAYLRVIANPSDEVSLRRIINVPERKIGDVTLERLAAQARDEGVTLYESLVRGERIGLRKQAEDAVREFVSLIERYRGLARELAASRLLAALVDEIGYREYLLRHETPAEVEDRMENVRALLVAMEEFEEREGGGVGEFLEQVSLLADHERRDERGAAVSLMTLHAAKGLEFSVVFMVGMEEGLFPLSRAMDEPELLEEERRLCYVGMTRARQRLFLVNAEKRRLYGRTSYSRPSRFLLDIPAECLDSAGDRPVLPSIPIREEGVKGATAERNHNLAAAVVPDALPEVQVVFGDDDDDGIRVGARVTHQMFGRGTVRKVEGRGVERKVIVWFDSVGPKKLLLRFAGLSPL